MKNLAIIFSILLSGFAATASTSNGKTNIGNGYNGNAFIFVEGDVEFSVFPDGQFDFIYVGPQKGSQVVFSSPNMNVSFNSGYNYDTYVQYDMYGAVIQIENVPVYYDEYGRIIKAGNVDIRYNDRRLVNVGGLRIFYNNHGYFSHCTGFINVFNPYYVYRPWHGYYARPIYTHVIVYDYPYRQYYRPIRYSYHDHVIYYRNRNNVAYQNGRRDFFAPGSRIHRKDGQVRINKDFNPNRTNTMVANTGRNSSGNGRDKNTNPVRNSPANVRNNESHVRSSETKNQTSSIGSVRNANTGSQDIRTSRVPAGNESSVRNPGKTAIRNSNSSMNSQTVKRNNTSSSFPTRSNAQPVRPNSKVSSSSPSTDVNRASTRSNISGNSDRGNSSRQNNSIRTRG